LLGHHHGGLADIDDYGGIDRSAAFQGFSGIVDARDDLDGTAAVRQRGADILDRAFDECIGQ